MDGQARAWSALMNVPNWPGAHLLAHTRDPIWVQQVRNHLAKKYRSTTTWQNIHHVFLFRIEPGFSLDIAPKHIRQGVLSIMHQLCLVSVYIQSPDPQDFCVRDDLYPGQSIVQFTAIHKLKSQIDVPCFGKISRQTLNQFMVYSKLPVYCYHGPDLLSLQPDLITDNTQVTINMDYLLVQVYSGQKIIKTRQAGLVYDTFLHYDQQTDQSPLYLLKIRVPESEFELTNFPPATDQSKGTAHMFPSIIERQSRSLLLRIGGPVFCLADCDWSSASNSLKQFVYNLLISFLRECQANGIEPFALHPVNFFCSFAGDTPRLIYTQVDCIRKAV
jgi:hypothetical protein